MSNTLQNFLDNIAVPSESIFGSSKKNYDLFCKTFKKKKRSLLTKFNKNQITLAQIITYHENHIEKLLAIKQARFELVRSLTQDIDKDLQFNNNVDVDEDLETSAKKPRLMILEEEAEPSNATFVINGPNAVLKNVDNKLELKVDVDELDATVMEINHLKQVSFATDCAPVEDTHDSSVLIKPVFEYNDNQQHIENVEQINMSPVVAIDPIIEQIVPSNLIDLCTSINQEIIEETHHNSDTEEPDKTQQSDRSSQQAKSLFKSTYHMQFSTSNKTQRPAIVSSKKTPSERSIIRPNISTKTQKAAVSRPVNLPVSRALANSSMSSAGPKQITKTSSIGSKSITKTSMSSGVSRQTKVPVPSSGMKTMTNGSLTKPKTSSIHKSNQKPMGSLTTPKTATIHNSIQKPAVRPIVTKPSSTKPLDHNQWLRQKMAQNKTASSETSQPNSILQLKNQCAAVAFASQKSSASSVSTIASNKSNVVDPMPSEAQFKTPFNKKRKTILSDSCMKIIQSHESMDISDLLDDNSSDEEDNYEKFRDRLPEWTKKSKGTIEKLIRHQSKHISCRDLFRDCEAVSIDIKEIFGPSASIKEGSLEEWI